MACKATRQVRVKRRLADLAVDQGIVTDQYTFTEGSSGLRKLSKEEDSESKA
jgi:hypothetical protein